MVPLLNATLVGNNTVPISAQQAVLDTGSSVMTAPDNDAIAINSVRPRSHSNSMHILVSNWKVAQASNRKSAPPNLLNLLEMNKLRIHAPEAAPVRVAEAAHCHACADMRAPSQNITGLEYDPNDNLFKVIGGCANISGLPNITFTLGKHQFPLTPAQYLLQVSRHVIKQGDAKPHTPPAQSRPPLADQSWKGLHAYQCLFGTAAGQCDKCSPRHAQASAKHACR